MKTLKLRINIALFVRLVAARSSASHCLACFVYLCSEGLNNPFLLLCTISEIYDFLVNDEGILTVVVVVCLRSFFVFFWSVASTANKYLVLINVVEGRNGHRACRIYMGITWNGLLSTMMGKRRGGEAYITNKLNPKELNEK